MLTVAFLQLSSIYFYWSTRIWVEKVLCVYFFLVPVLSVGSVMLPGKGPARRPLWLDFQGGLWKLTYGHVNDDAAYLSHFLLLSAAWQWCVLVHEGDRKVLCGAAGQVPARLRQHPALCVRQWGQQRPHTTHTQELTKSCGFRECWWRAVSVVSLLMLYDVLSAVMKPVSMIVQFWLNLYLLYKKRKGNIKQYRLQKRSDGIFFLGGGGVVFHSFVFPLPS